jgi:hypothetical protein
MYPESYHSLLLLFSDNVTEEANNELLPIYSIVYHGYRKHATWVFWSNG